MLTLEQKTYINSFIKDIYVINLPHRTDRLAANFNQVAKISDNPLSSKIIDGIRFTDLHYLSGRAGCSAAMCKSLTVAYENNLDNFLLLEDDAYFIDERLLAIYNACKDLSKINWDICYLGARIKSPMTDFSPGLYRIHNWGCNHAVLYNRKCIKYLIDLLPKWDAGYNIWMDWIMKNECFDTWQPKILGQNADFYCFHTKELVSLQLANFSDLNQKHSDGIKILEDDFERNRPQR